MAEKYIHQVNDKIDFGRYSGLTFLEIFQYTRNYIEWLIQDTQHCFCNLQDFLASGMPYDIKPDRMSRQTQQAVLAYLAANTVPSSAGGYRIDKRSATQLIANKILPANALVEVPYEFSVSLVQHNIKKLAATNK